ncbi:MAG TPA: ribosome-associated translation inhibitor RaiA [Stellaceae bacterium]|nr:ribosome-associated translation inhibitor RaiA [Stellaceae bacterium]
MHITATGKQIDVGKYLRDHVETATTMIVGKYFDKAIEAHIIFYRERHLILANVMVHAIGGMAVQCHGEADTATAAFDQAITRLDKRLRRFKRRLRNHHAKSKLDGNIPAEGENEPLAQDKRSEVELITAEPRKLIVAEMETDIPSLSVGEAVEYLDPIHRPALLFRNGLRGKINLVYCRGDGNFGWVDPDPTPRTPTT